MEPGFGFRRTGLGPVAQCIDTGFEVFTQIDEIRIFRREKIYDMFLVRKSLSNMTCFVIQRSLNHSGSATEI